MRTIAHPAAVAACGPELADALRKRFETARAHAMWFHGYALSRTDDDRGRATYIATRGAATFPFGDLAAVEAWLARLDSVVTEVH